MPSASKNELRRHIKLVPLPISGQKGIKIQARCDTVYNPTEPSRDVVRKDNYHRRQQQVLNQGFRSVNFRPYQGIGDPFYLEERELALRALGQWDGVNDNFLLYQCTTLIVLVLILQVLLLLIDLYTIDMILLPSVNSVTQQTRNIDSMLDQCWSIVVDGGTRLVQHWV